MTTTIEANTIRLQANGERYTYSAHADNPERRWMLRCYFTMYGQRCESFRDVRLPESITSRPLADAFVRVLAMIVGATATEWGA